MKRTITFLIMIVLFCAASSFAQTKRAKRSAIPIVKPGYYFTLHMCHACAYFGWHEDAIKWFRAKGIPAAMGEGYVKSKSLNLPFAPIRVFKWDRSVPFWLIELYVGPFASEQAALRALDDFPSVLIRITEKRNAKTGTGFTPKLDLEEDYPVDRNEVVTRTSGNSYQYGFFFLEAYNLR